jgi:hypothetical protein
MIAGKHDTEAWEIDYPQFLVAFLSTSRQMPQ